MRYFSKFKSEPLRPYIIFQVYAYKIYEKHGYLSLNSKGKVCFDDSKTLPVLDEFKACWLRILDCEDANDGAGLEAILNDMLEETEFVKHVVLKVNSPNAASGTPPVK